jgi:hypothetical protein
MRIAEQRLDGIDSLSGGAFVPTKRILGAG